jgi:hypothetical protein
VIEAAVIRPTEYVISGHDLVYVRCCPVHATHRIGGGIIPYWYVAKPLFRDEDPVAFDMGLKVWYWTGEGWRNTTPKQFTTPEGAAADYLSHGDAP